MSQNVKSGASLSPRLIVDAACIPIPLSNNHDVDRGIIRPTPRRPTEKASSSERLGDSDKRPVVERRALTDPRQAKPQSIPEAANPIKLKENPKVPPAAEFLLPERDLGANSSVKTKGYVTNVRIDKSKDEVHGTQVTVDSGFQILSSKDEEAERDHGAAARRHDHSPASNQQKMYKPKRRSIINTEHGSHEHLVQKFRGKKNHEDRKKLDDNVNHLLDVKAAIERLKLQSADEENSSHSSSSYSSTGSDNDQNAASSKYHHTGSQNQQHLSQETLNASTVTSADEFVWIDSHNRLVELQQLPWNTVDIRQVIVKFMDADYAHPERITADILARLSYYLQRVLVRLAREAQRLSKALGKCGQTEVATALKIVLSPSLATTAFKACLRASAMYAISGEATRQSKSDRAGLTLKVGRMHQWMCLVKVGKYIQNQAAIYLTAGMESILEKVLSCCMEMAGRDTFLSAPLLEQAVAANGDLWGMFQPYAHLSSSRISSGTLTLASSVETVIGGGGMAENGSRQSKANERNVKQILLTTCVGSLDELEEMVLIAGSIIQKVWQTATASAPNSHSYGGAGPLSRPGSLVATFRSNLSWTADSVSSLYHFMRCSQLEYVGQDGRSPIQELVYERPYMVLPPIMEWVRVVYALAEHRSSVTVDRDDVLQAARILLPGMDCPPRPLNDPEPVFSCGQDELEYVSKMKQYMAFHMLLSGRRDLVPHALQFLPSTMQQIPLRNSVGMTPLQVAAVRGDIGVARTLIDTGADIEQESEGNGNTEHWTALTFASISGNYKCARLLLERGARVNGGCSAEGVVGETPLQVAAGAGHVRIVELLLSYGASPFMSTNEESGPGLPSKNQTGCPSSVSVAAMHGHRRLLHVMVTQCMSGQPSGDDQHQGDEQVLSLEEILAEGIASSKDNGRNAKSTSVNETTTQNVASKLSKSQTRKLQEAMYHASECGNIELTLDLRNLGIHWSPFTWTQTLQIAHDNQILPVINELLQDFDSSWLEEQSCSFMSEVALPLLFAIFRACKNEGTILILADIFAICYGRNPNHKVELKISASEIKNPPPPRIDSKFVNNPELSDVQFRVEGRIFYAHKLALVTASQRFQSMLNSRFCEGSPPVLQINDIRYDIFHLVMTYLYNGGLGKLKVDGGDVLELMAAANFFQLPGLLKHCELLCSKLVDLDNIVSYYIHAKVYSATDLLDFCESFLLKNMVALLTYDDSVKRLLFGKKLQNHDVLGGLVRNLQKRVASRSK